MGACLPPGKAFIFSYISYIPYLLIFLFIGLTLFSRNLRQFRMVVLLITGYLVGDRIMKNLIQSPRPEGSCKKSFGMPSSHMLVITMYAMELWMKSKKTQKIFLLFLVVSQGVARVELNYHTYEQVFAGIVFGIVYLMLFHQIWVKVEMTSKFKTVMKFLRFKMEEKRKSEWL